jgi:hypothetical protein
VTELQATDATLQQDDAALQAALNATTARVPELQALIVSA